MIPDHITVDVLEIGIELEESNDSLPEIIYSADFVYTLKFTARTKEADTGGGSGGEEGGAGGTTPSPEVIVSATNVTLESPFRGITVTSIEPDTIRLSGSYLLAFDDYYKFVRKSGEQIILPPDTEEKEIALIQYKMPSQTTREFIFNITVEWPVGASYEGVPISNNVLIKQESFWTTGAASANIAKLKDKGF
jgi:hypothetical protein